MTKAVTAISCYVVMANRPWIAIHREGLDPVSFRVSQQRWERLLRVLRHRGGLFSAVTGSSLVWRPR
jgi:hypothetical protein